MYCKCVISEPFASINSLSWFTKTGGGCSSTDERHQQLKTYYHHARANKLSTTLPLALLCESRPSKPDEILMNSRAQEALCDTKKKIYFIPSVDNSLLVSFILTKNLDVWLCVSENECAGLFSHYSLREKQQVEIGVWSTAGCTLTSTDDVFKPSLPQHFTVN